MSCQERDEDESVYIHHLHSLGIRIRALLPLGLRSDFFAHSATNLANVLAKLARGGIIITALNDENERKKKVNRASSLETGVYYAYRAAQKVDHTRYIVCVGGKGGAKIQTAELRS